MKKAGITAVFLIVSAAALSAQISRGANVWVASKSVTLKSSTGFFASGRGTLSYGDEVTVLQVKDKWAEVRSKRNSSLSGWVSSSSLSAKRIVVSSSTGSASASEIALAGKGFNQEVENAYKADGDLNYADVDRTEAILVSPDELYRFVNEGHLNTGEN
jgi:SH3-like domain-containing protein